MNTALMLLILLVAPALVIAGEGDYRITITGGTVYGPGPMPAGRVPKGLFTNVILDEKLSGKVDFFNNGPEEPNIPGEKDIFGSFRGGLLSNGVPFNEHLNGGVVDIGQGALRMLAVATSGGPNKGVETYRIDERLNWRLRADLALDPGYPEGLVVANDLDISSGVIWAPPSHQTEAGLAGGFDHADYVPTGSPVFGALGDSDDDGFLDGCIVGVARTPLEFLFAPGAPLIMTRIFITDIPVSRRLGAILELASVANLKLVLAPPNGEPESGSPVAAYYQRMLPEWAKEFVTRARHAAAVLEDIGADEAALARQLAETLTAAESEAGDLATYTRRVAASLETLEQALPQLRSAFEAATVGER